MTARPQGSKPPPGSPESPGPGVPGAPGAMPSGAGRRTFSLAMPALRRGQKLAFSFDEDELTLAWEALRSARLPAGTRVAAAGFEVPAWFWKGAGIVPDEGAATKLRLVPTSAGPAVLVSEAAEDVEDEAARRLSAAPTRPESEWQGHRLARDAPDSEADFPLGAHVVAARHDEVLAERMRFPDGKVGSWTAISAGAAPSEFSRLQQAVGTYHVVLVALADGRRTVGIWTGLAPPATGQGVRPVLRRLYRQQGAWRHGVKFAPAT